MVELLIIGITWVAALVCIAPAWRRRRFLLLGGTLSLAITLTLQAEVVYRAIDPMLGGLNLTNLAFRTSGMICFAFFDLAVFRALHGGTGKRRPWRVWAGTGFGVGIQTALFFSRPWPLSGPHLEAYQDEWRIIAYQSVFWIAIGTVAIHTGLATLRDTRGRPWTPIRAGVTLIGCGTLPALAWCLLTVVEVLVAVPNQQEIARLLILLTTACISFGVMITAASSVFDFFLHLAFIARTRPIWLRARAAAPEISLDGSLSTPLQSLVQSAPQILYRRWIEIEDAARLNKIALSKKEQRTLGRVARLMNDESGLPVMEELSHSVGGARGRDEGL